MFNFRALHETRAVFISHLFSLYCIIRSLILCLITLSQGLHGHSQLSYTLQYIDFSYAKNIFTWVHIKFTVITWSFIFCLYHCSCWYILSISVHRFGQRLLRKLLDLLTATYSIEVQNIWDFTPTLCSDLLMASLYTWRPQTMHRANQAFSSSQQEISIHTWGLLLRTNYSSLLKEFINTATTFRSSDSRGWKGRKIITPQVAFNISA